MLENKLINLFRHYYANLKEEDIIIDDLDKREFAFWNFDESTMRRHISFLDGKSLKEFLIKVPPRHAFYSISTYEYPSSTSMELKNIIRTDLVFDIDIDHIPTPCKSNHDYWVCKSCGSSGKGFSERCNSCNSSSIAKFSFVCNECLDFAKEEILKLIEDFLFTDLGINKDEVKIFFSGNRGYHVHVKNEELSSLDSRARSMLVDYIKGTSFRLYFFEFLKKKGRLLGINSMGFFSRFAEKLFEEIMILKEEDLYKEGMSREKVREVMEKKEKILQELQQHDLSYSFLRLLGKKSKELVYKSIAASSVEIDERVTVDLHRLIRMPNSLHGKTALRVFPLSYESLDSFEPFKDSIVFKKGYGKVYYKEKRWFPKLVMNGVEYDLNELENKEIPLYLALYLHLNGYAVMYELSYY